MFVDQWSVWHWGNYMAEMSDTRNLRGPETLTLKTRLSTKPLLWKWVLFAWEYRINFISMTSLALLWNRGFRKLGNGPAGGGSHVARLNFKTSCVGVCKCLSLIVGFAVTVTIWPREVVSCCDFILRTVATFWAMSLVRIYPGRTSCHPWSQKTLVTHHQAEWSNMSLLIPERIGYYIKGDK